MKRFLFAIGACSILFSVVACGNNPAVQSSTMDRSEPDYKTKDGQSIASWVKKTENQKAVCEVLRTAKQNGIPSSSPEATQLVAQRFELHPAEAEIVAIYAIEFGCPDLQ
ncbi:hypothetical protein EBR21_03115 [bacterium]|nr:hypothetical protein [bacterium]